MKIVKAIDILERVLITILFACMVLAIFGQVVNRNFLKLEISWFEELARGCMIYMLMFGTEMSLREHSQLNVDSLVRRLPPKVSRVFDHLSTIAVLVFTGIVGYASFKFVGSHIQMGGVMPALQIPKYWFSASVSIGMVFIFLTQIIILINTILKAINKKNKKEAEEA